MDANVHNASLASYFITAALSAILLSKAYWMWIVYHQHGNCLRYFVTCGITHSAKCRCLSYSEADFEFFFAPQTHCTDWGEIWYGGGVPDFTPIGATVRVYRIGPPKTDIFTEL